MNFIQSIFNPKKIKISLDNKSYEKLNLGDFFYLKELLDSLKKSLQEYDAELFINNVNSIIKLQTKKEVKINNVTNLLRSLLEIKYYNLIESNAVFLKQPPEKNKKESEKVRYDYAGRNLAVWINVFAEKYHWDIDKILSLSIDVAVYLMQEIMVSEHFDKEFEYSLSEIAYQYDKSSNKSNYVPMKKPYWMDDAVDNKIIKNMKYNKNMLPKGNVVDLSGVGLLKDDQNN